MVDCSLEPAYANLSSLTILSMTYRMLLRFLWWRLVKSQSIINGMFVFHQATSLTQILTCNAVLKNMCSYLVALGALRRWRTVLQHHLEPSAPRSSMKWTKVCFFLVPVLLIYGPYILLLLDKDVGNKTTLPEFLKDYSKDKKLKKEYEKCNKGDLLTDFHNAKEADESVPKRLSNVAVSQGVRMKMECITTFVCLHSFSQRISQPVLVPGPQLLIWDRDRPFFLLWP